MLLRKPFIDRHAIGDEKSTKAEARSGAADSRPGSSVKAPAPSVVQAENARLPVLSFGVLTVAKAAATNPSSARLQSRNQMTPRPTIAELQQRCQDKSRAVTAFSRTTA